MLVNAGRRCTIMASMAHLVLDAGVKTVTMRLAWLTDLHLNFVKDDGRRALVDKIKAASADAILIGGDTGEASSFARYLEELAANLTMPIYFVLGNHDYYRGSIAAVRDTARSLSRNGRELTWLPDARVVELGERTALVGHGGWGDGRVGDFLASTVVLNDYFLISELHETHEFPEKEPILTQALLAKLNALGDEAAAHFREVLPEVPPSRDEIVVLTHVPPFHEACWHEGHLSDMNWTPHFVCRAVGEVLVEFMERNPAKRMTVLCGHTHSGGEARILSNLRVLTGQARYGDPKVQQVLTIE